MSDEEIARKVAAFLDEAKKQPKPKVPSWSQIIDLYVKNPIQPVIRLTLESSSRSALGLPGLLMKLVGRS
ncbi:MAG: hypothetical protein QW335_08270 [Candidatus Nezhaarchaeales archaeon]